VERAREELHKYMCKIPEFRTAPHEEIVLCGPALATIIEMVEMKGIDLVVMGSHGRGGLGKMVLGSVAEAAIRRLHCPVLVIGPLCTHRLRSLKSTVLATDLPAGSLRAGQYAASISRASGCALTVVHVVPEHLDVHCVESLTSALMDLRRLVPSDDELRKRVALEIVKGEPAAEILRVAEAANADLIVMGVKECSTMTNHAPWTALSKVIREAECPVLAVQPHLV